MGIEEEVEELKHRVEALGQLTRSVLSKVSEVRIECSVPRSLRGRALRKDNQACPGGLLYEWRSASDVARELLRRGWASKDFKHVRLALEHLVALEVLERERKPGRKAKWLYRKAEMFEERIVIAERVRNDQ